MAVLLRPSRLPRAGTFLICAALLALSAGVFPSAARADDFASRQKGFILDLFRQKEYFNCIAETRRLLAYESAIPRREEYLYFIEANYFLGGQYKSVIFHLAGGREAESLPAPELLLLSSSYARLGMSGESEKSLAAADYGRLEEPWRYELLVRRIELMLSGSRYRDAITELDRASESGIDKSLTGRLRIDLQKYTDIRRKSALGAAALSACVPGAGQAYAGRYAESAASLLSMAALLGGTALAFHRGDRASGFTLAFFSALVYSGNIYGAWNSAENYNRIQDSRFRSGITARHIPPYDPVRYMDMEGMFRR